MAKYVTNPHEKYYFATQIFIMSRRNRRNFQVTQITQIPQILVRINSRNSRNLPLQRCSSLKIFLRYLREIFSIYVLKHKKYDNRFPNIV